MIIQDLFESPQLCPECGGISFSDLILAEKKDACYYKVKASAKVWPSAYASGRLVQCRKKGAANYGKSKNEGVAEDFTDDVDNIYAMHPQPEKSEKIAFLILDKDEIEFATDWRELSDPYQQEFGYDLPLWDADDFGSYPNLVVKRITFDQYVNLVGNYIESEELAGSAMSKMKRGVTEDSLNEFAPGSGGDGRWYTDDEIADIIGEDWLEFDLSGEAANISIHGEHAKILLVQEAQAYFEDRGYYGVVVQDVRDDEDYLSWYISGNFTRADEGVAEDAALAEEFDLIESTVERLAKHNDVDAELIWEDLESLSDDELYVFAVTMPLMEDWQKANKQDRTDGMSRRAVKAYRREHPGSKLKTAVTTKPSKLKRGSKASKRRKSYCSRSRGQMKMHSISCAKTPDKAICKARRRWNCE